jgi:uncharacterized membrane protein
MLVLRAAKSLQTLPPDSQKRLSDSGQARYARWDAPACARQAEARPYNATAHFLTRSFSRFFSSLMNSCTSLKSMYTLANRT